MGRIDRFIAPGEPGSPRDAQCAAGDPDEPGGRCRLVVTHRHVTDGGRRRTRYLCSDHYWAQTLVTPDLSASDGERAEAEHRKAAQMAAARSGVQPHAAAGERPAGDDTAGAAGGSAPAPYRPSGYGTRGKHYGWRRPGVEATRPSDDHPGLQPPT